MGAAPRVVAGIGLVAALNVCAGGVVVAARRPAPPVPTAATAEAPGVRLVNAVHPLLPTGAGSQGQPGRRAIREVESTGYCLVGETASGRFATYGMVAMNGVPLGSEWRLLQGPLAGRTVEVTDRIGHGTEFDIWFDDCADAADYGRRDIAIERVG